MEGAHVWYHFFSSVAGWACLWSYFHWNSCILHTNSTTHQVTYVMDDCVRSYCNRVPAWELKAGIALPSQVKTQYLQISNIVDTYIKYPISGQSTTVVKGCIWLIWQILPLVMEEYWSSANFFKNIPRWKKVVCMKSEMQILHFYLVGQSYTEHRTFYPAACSIWILTSRGWGRRQTGSRILNCFSMNCISIG